MRDWALKGGDPLSLNIAADLRLCHPDYPNDHIWEFNFGGSEPPAPTKTDMSLRVTEHDERYDRDWEGYVARHPAGTLFHTLTWRDAVREAFGHKGRYLSAWRGGDLAGVFPLMLVRSRLAGRMLVSVPYGVYGGTLADDDDAHTALLEAAQQLAEQLRCQWIDIRSIEPQWPQLPVVRRYVTFRKQLPDDPARVLSELPRKARAAARHARDRHRLEAVFDDSQLGVVWSLYSKSMRRLASPNYPLRFFTALMERTVPTGPPGPGDLPSGPADRRPAQFHLPGRDDAVLRRLRRAVREIMSQQLPLSDGDGARRGAGLPHVRFRPEPPGQHRGVQLQAFSGL